jgi:FHA domain
MSHGLLEILRYFFLALLWLFFLYAARMVLVEVRRARLETAAVAEVSVTEPRPHEREVRLRLRVVEPAEDAGRVIELEHEATFGRSPACTIPLADDNFASSVHARVFRDGGDVFIEDLNSTNGTFVNEVRVSSPRELRRGDEITIGHTVLEVAR